MYNLGIHILSFFLWIIAPFNSKIKSGVNGRKKAFNTLTHFLNKADKTIWFHCASLGEYEQGLPVFEILRSRYPKHKIILSFFSPSGYEIKKTSPVADVVIYLPLDTKSNAKRFINTIKPEFAVFVKYDIWPNLLLELKNQNRRAILISALFRKNQIYFKSYGKKSRKALFAFEHIFTQDKPSKTLLESINYTAVSVAGDTRFDRVSKQLSMDNSVPFIAQFKANTSCMVFGSTWPADDLLFLNYINHCTDKHLKFVIAPHNVKPEYIKSITSQLKVSTICYSNMQNHNLADFKVFILDTIGYLSKVYHYANIAYVGGGAGSTGLHNILEPAVFGIPILIGNNYDKFPEAKTLVMLGGVTTIPNATVFKTTLETLQSQTALRIKQGAINASYVQNNTGAVTEITNYITL